MYWFDKIALWKDGRKISVWWCKYQFCEVFVQLKIYCVFSLEDVYFACLHQQSSYTLRNRKFHTTIKRPKIDLRTSVQQAVSKFCCIKAKNPLSSSAELKTTHTPAVYDAHQNTYCKCITMSGYTAVLFPNVDVRQQKWHIPATVCMVCLVCAAGFNWSILNGATRRNVAGVCWTYSSLKRQIKFGKFKGQAVHWIQIGMIHMCLDLPFSIFINLSGKLLKPKD